MKDPLHAKAIVFRQGDESAALVFCDLIGVPRDVSQAARAPSQRSHGHSGRAHRHRGHAFAHRPAVFRCAAQPFSRAAVERSGSDPYEKIDYPKLLVEKLAAAIDTSERRTRTRAATCRLRREDRLSFNRRFHMKDGSVRFNPGELNPDIVRPAGPIDPQVGNSRCRHPTGRSSSRPSCPSRCTSTPRAAPNTRPTIPSLSKTTARSLRPEFTLLFGAGTCGDINHIDVTTRAAPAAEQIGSMLAETIAGAMSDNSIAPISRAVAGRSQRKRRSRRCKSIPTKKLPTARKNMELVGSRELPFLEQVEGVQDHGPRSERRSETWPLEVQAFRLESMTPRSSRCPAKCSSSWAWRSRRPRHSRRRWSSSSTNDSPAYIPTKKAFAEGSYEIVNSRIATRRRREIGRSGDPPAEGIEMNPALLADDMATKSTKSQKEFT